MRTITVVPAYGRDYKSKKEVQASWINQSWLIQDTTLSGYVGKGQQQSLTDNGVSALHFRYRQQRNVTVLDLSSNKWS